MKLTKSFLNLLIVFFIVSTTASCLNNDQSNQNIDTAKNDVAYENIMKTHTIKVGYVPYPPGLIKDPNTGALSGIFYDALESIGKATEMKIEWTEEVSWGTMIEGLKTKKYDIIGSPVWANSSRGKVASFTTPLYFSGIGAYVKVNDNRFDNNTQNINNPDIKISTIDGEMSSIIASASFYKAKQITLPQLSDVSQLLVDVDLGKSDVTFVEPYVAERYMEGKAASLKNISEKNPLRVFPNSIMLNNTEIKLKNMLDIAIQEQLNAGTIDKLVLKYTGSDKAFYFSALPYRQ